MPTYMLHFTCTPETGAQSTRSWVANSCTVAPDLAQAEKRARQLIRQHHYTAGELIAFSELDEGHISSLSELESTLFLKAQANKGAAVLFSQGG